MLVRACALGTGRATAPDASGARIQVTYVEQPTGINLADYVAAWPDLAPWVAALRGARDSVRVELRRMADSRTPSDGGLNLLAQLARAKLGLPGRSR